MSTDAVVSAAADTYLSIPVNFGADNNLIQLAEKDAFIAGVAWLMGHPDEYQRLRKEWP